MEVIYTGLRQTPEQIVATAMQEDAAAMAAGVSKAMNEWQADASQAVSTLDTLFVVSQKTGVGVSRLADDIAKYGPVLRGMGFGFSEAAAMLGQFERAGVEAESVLAGMKMGLAKMGKAGVADPISAFRALAAQIKATKTQAEATTLAVQMFGSRGAVAMAAAIRDGRMEIDALVESLREAPGAIARTAKQTDDLKEAWGRLRNQGQLLLAPVGGAALLVAFISLRAAESFSAASSRRRWSWARVTSRAW
jgi:phage-related minor tail protein